MDTVEREIPYRPNWATLILSGLFFCGCGVVLAWKAHANTRGLIINGLIELSPGSATVFYGVLAGLSVGFVLMASLLVVGRLSRPQRIAFTREGVIVPRSRWSADEIQVHFSSMERLELSEISGQKFIRVYHSGGKFSIASSMLPSKQVYEEILQRLSERIKQKP